MKDYLKRSGLAAFIIVSVAATAFLPKRISQAVILAAFLILMGLALFRLLDKHKDALKAQKKEKLFQKPDREKIGAEVHLSHRITDKLHSAYPNATWRWKGKMSNEFLEKGGSARIETSDIEDNDTYTRRVPCGCREVAELFVYIDILVIMTAIPRLAKE